MTHVLSCRSKQCTKTACMGKLTDNHMIHTSWILSENILYSVVNDIATECEKHNLNVGYNKSSLDISGPVKYFDKLLNCDLHNFIIDDKSFHSPNSDVLIPNQWKDYITDILGLDSYPIAKPYVQFAKDKLESTTTAISTRAMDISSSSTFTSTQVASLYNFPKNLDGLGQTIGIISLGGGYNPSDINTYLINQGINIIPSITDISIDGATNKIGFDRAFNTENILDIEVPISIVPKANFRVYFAPNSFKGFYNAIKRAIDDKCNVISISWGAPETLWPVSSLNSFNSLFYSATKKNITVLAASGDNGSTDGTTTSNVDFPSSSPYVISCGGTKLIANQSTIVSETVWNNNPTTNATGGGVSSFFPRPPYQSDIKFNLKGKRGVPDIAGNADPNTGYNLYMDGSFITIGGTSAVAPLMAGLVAQINQHSNRNIGYIHDILYTNPSVFRDILQGNNGAYAASVGWDACSGNGSPDGSKILSLFKEVPIVKPITDLTPIADFDTKISGLTVTLTDKSKNKPTQWIWSFGDEISSQTRNTTHTYAKSGTYTIVLAVKNSAGINKLSKQINIMEQNLNVKLTADFKPSKYVAQIGSAIKFTDLTNNDTVNKWSWNFGDGFTNFTLKNPYHTYYERGTFNVTLVVSNGVSSDTITKKSCILIK